MADVERGGVEIIDTRKYYCQDFVVLGTINRVPVKLHIQPTVVILSLRADEAVEKCFDPEGRSRDSVVGDGKHYALGKKDSLADAQLS